MSDIIESASTKIAGKKHGYSNEVKAQVTKAKNERVGNTHTVVANLLSSTKKKVKI